MQSPDVFVCDASALVEILLRTTLGNSVESGLRLRHHRLHVPGLCDVEVVSALRRCVRQRVITRARAVEAVTDYLDLSLERHGHHRFLQRMFDLQDNFTASDAAYVALAEWLGADLVTTDTKLARAAKKHVGIHARP